MTFLLSEDKALRQRLQGITVHDQKSEGDGLPRPVRVYFGQPDQETTPQLYPYITIDLINVVRESDREMRMPYHEPSYMRPADLPDNQIYSVSEIIPVGLDYQITTYSRHPRHDREIISQLLTTVLPIRFGSLDIDDNTVRRLDVTNISKRDMTESGKRLFVNAITVRVSSEIAHGTLETLYKVLEVHIDNPTPAHQGGRNSFPVYSGVGPSIITE